MASTRALKRSPGTIENRYMEALFSREESGENPSIGKGMQIRTLFQVLELRQARFYEGVTACAGGVYSRQAAS